MLQSQVVTLAAAFSRAWTDLFGCETHFVPLDAREPLQAGCCRVCSEMAMVADSTLWELDRQLVGCLVDIQAGGEDTASARTHGPLTNVEQALVGRAVDMLRLSVNRSRLHGEQTGDAYLKEIGEVLSIPERTSAWQATDSRLAETPLAHALSFQVHLLQTRGTLTWWLSPEHLQLLQPPAPQPMITAALAEFELPLSELLELSVGDVIATELAPTDSIFAIDESGNRRSATLGQSGPFKAIQLHSQP